MAHTTTLDRFLGEISRILRQKNAFQLQEYLVIEPPYGDLYKAMINEIRRVYPKENESNLETKCSGALPEARDVDEGATWTAFVKFMVQYLCFLRDVNVENLLDTYNLLSELVQKCNSALGHASLGILMLPTVVSYSKMLSRLAIGLDKQPGLIAHLTKRTTDDEAARETLPERAANIIRHAFVTCLNDRSGALGKPEGKRRGIYKIANLCLKVLFQCRKTRNAEQIFTNIYKQSPPLALYPRSERVTYLYYLGRFLFSNNHFYKAHLALQSAYSECHVKCIKQRRLILIYFMASDIILGRFPSQGLYQRAEAAGLAAKFQPICKAIARGDLATFRKLFDFGNPDAAWFLHFRIFLQLKNRCEILVWRSLVRKVFVLNGAQGDAEARRAPTFNLVDVMHLAQFLEKKSRPPGLQPGQRHPNGSYMESPKDNNAEAYVDPDLDGADDLELEPLLADMLEVESILSSLIDQGLLNGFISHRLHRFAIQGAKRRGALAAGFPNVWQTIKGKSDDEVPGWKKEAPTFAHPGLGRGQFGPGMVINLSGARPAGAAP